MVGTRSCTQIRTHAQKYFIALQKSPHIGGNSAPGGGSSRNGDIGMKGGKESFGHRKKSKLLGEHLKRGNGAASGGGGADMSSSALFGGQSGFIRKQRGLTGIEVLAQAAETESDYDTLEPSADYYRQSQGSPRKRKNGAMSNGGSDNDSSSGEEDDDDDDEEESDSEDGEDEDSREDRQEETTEKKEGAPPSKVPSHATSSRASPLTSSTANGHASERAAALALIESSTGRRIGPPEASAGSNDDLEQLREQLRAAKQTIWQLEKQSHEAELKAVAAIDDKARAVAEIKALQEINGQLKAEHRRAMVMLEHSAGPAAARNHLAQQLESRMGMGGNPSAIMAAAAAHGLSPAAAAAMAQQHQQAASLQHQHHHPNHAHVIELLQNQLTEAELRFHQVTESLTRQTSVLTDQHRAILELNNKLEKEKAKRRVAEMELNRFRGSG